MNTSRFLNFRKFIPAILVQFFLISNLTATNYYVSNSGDDNAAGTSPGAAWQTIGKVNNSDFQPGDSILFERGGVWRSTLYMQSSGTEQDYIIFSNYGSKNLPNPKILGSDVSSGWTSVGNNVWQSTDDFENPRWIDGGEAGNVWFELADRDTTVWGEYQGDNIVDVVSEYDFAYTGNSVYVYSESNPSAQYESVEICQRTESIFLNDKDYLEIDGIDLGYGANAGVWERWPTSERYGFIVRNCKIGHIGIKNSPSAFGIYTWHSDFLAENNVIHDCGRRSISYFSTNGPEITFGRAVVQDNYFYNGWHTTGLDLIVQSGSNASVDSVIFRRNICYEDPRIPRTNGEDPSNHVFVADQSGSAAGNVSNIYIYNNIFVYAPGSSIKTEMVQNLNVVNNTFYGFNNNLGLVEGNIFQSLLLIGGDTTRGTSATVLNNIFYSNSNPDDNVNLNGLSMDKDINSPYRMHIDYNLFDTEDPGARAVTFYPSGSPVAYTLQQWQDSRHNLGYGLNAPEVGNSRFVDPPFDLRVEQESNAVGAGIPIPYITTDFSGFKRDPLTPTIGAIEYVSPDSSLAYIGAFILKEQTGPAVIDTANKTITIEVKDYTDLTSLSPTIVTNLGAELSPASGTEQNLSSPFVYTVVAADGVTEVAYTVYVTVAENRAPEITEAFILGNALIDSTISVDYEYYDYEGDPEGATEIEWYVNNNLKGSSAMYTVTEADSSFTIHAVITPVATSGELTGEPFQTEATDVVVPFSVKVVSAEIGNESDSIIQIEFDSELIESIVPANADFEVRRDGDKVEVVEVEIDQNTVLLSLESDGKWGEVFLVSYSRGSSILQADNGISVLSFNDTLVENNIETHLAENLLLWSEQLEMESWANPYDTYIEVDQHEDLEGNNTMEFMSDGGNPHYLIMVRQTVVGNVKGNTTYTLAFDVQTEEPSTGGDGWRAEIQENEGANYIYFLWGDSVSGNEVQRLEFEFTTQSGTDEIRIAPIDRYSPDNTMHLGRVQLYEGTVGSKKYVATEGEQIINMVIPDDDNDTTDTTKVVVRSEMLGNDILLSPNPARNQLSIEFPDDYSGSFSEPYKISIYNSLGQLAVQNELPMEKKNVIDISALNNGVYYIYLSNHDRSLEAKKLIIKR